MVTWQEEGPPFMQFPHEYKPPRDTAIRVMFVLLCCLCARIWLCIIDFKITCSDSCLGWLVTGATSAACTASSALCSNYFFLTPKRWPRQEMPSRSMQAVHLNNTFGFNDGICCSFYPTGTAKQKEKTVTVSSFLCKTRITVQESTQFETVWINERVERPQDIEENGYCPVRFPFTLCTVFLQ